MPRPGEQLQAQKRKKFRSRLELVWQLFDLRLKYRLGRVKAKPENSKMGSFIKRFAAAWALDSQKAGVRIDRYDSQGMLFGDDDFESSHPRETKARTGDDGKPRRPGQFTSKKDHESYEGEDKYKESFLEAKANGKSTNEAHDHAHEAAYGNGDLGLHFDDENGLHVKDDDLKARAKAEYEGLSEEEKNQRYDDVMKSLNGGEPSEAFKKAKAALMEGNKDEQRELDHMKEINLEEARALGRQAAEEGRIGNPAHDTALSKMLKGRTVGETPPGKASSIELMNAWQEAHDEQSEDPDTKELNYFSMSKSQLEEKAAEGDSEAQAELDRRAAKRAAIGEGKKKVRVKTIRETMDAAESGDEDAKERLAAMDNPNLKDEDRERMASLLTEDGYDAAAKASPNFHDDDVTDDEFDAMKKAEGTYEDPLDELNAIAEEAGLEPAEPESDPKDNDMLIELAKDRNPGADYIKISDIKKEMENDPELSIDEAVEAAIERDLGNTPPLDGGASLSDELKAAAEEAGLEPTEQQADEPAEYAKWSDVKKKMEDNPDLSVNDAIEEANQDLDSAKEEEAQDPTKKRPAS